MMAQRIQRFNCLKYKILKRNLIAFKDGVWQQYSHKDYQADIRNLVLSAVLKQVQIDTIDDFDATQKSWALMSVMIDLKAALTAEQQTASEHRGCFIFYSNTFTVKELMDLNNKIDVTMGVTSSNQIDELTLEDIKQAKNVLEKTLSASRVGIANKCNRAL